MKITVSADQCPAHQVLHLSAETRVVSITNCAPQRCRPSATTSSRRPSNAQGKKVHVPDRNIGRHSGTCYPANSGNGTLQGKTSSPKHSCSAACCVVVAKRVEKMATPARCERQEAKANEGVGEAAHGRGPHQCLSICSTVQRPMPLPKLDLFETSREVAPERPEKARLSLDGGGVQHEKLPHVANLARLCQAPSPRHHGLEGVHLGREPSNWEVQNPPLHPSTTLFRPQYATWECCPLPPMLRQSAQQRQGVFRGSSATNRPSLPRMQAHLLSLLSATHAEWQTGVWTTCHTDLATPPRCQRDNECHYPALLAAADRCETHPCRF